MQTNFTTCLAFVLAHEGGYVNDPHDPGGETNFGISRRAYPDLDIAGLTRAQAAAIYRRDYWDRVRGDDLPAGLDALVFDDAVNAGRGGAARRLQQAIGVAVDGVIGPRTLAEAALAVEVAALDETAARRMAHYGALSTFDRFGLGWSRRLMACHRLALALYAGVQ